MQLNRIQIQIFQKLCKAQEQDADEYVAQHSLAFLGMQKNSLSDLSEEEGDTWINKAYLQSLG